MSPAVCSVALHGPTAKGCRYRSLPCGLAIAPDGVLTILSGPSTREWAVADRGVVVTPAFVTAVLRSTGGAFANSRRNP